MGLPSAAERKGSGCSDVAPAISFHVTLRATPLGVQAALQRVMQKTRKHGLDRADRATLELVLAEVLNNIVEHACAKRPESLVSVTIRCVGHGLRIETRDPGLPMPGRKLPRGRMPDPTLPLACLPEGGFGWFLIFQLSERVVYRRIGNHNHISLQIPLHPQP